MTDDNRWTTELPEWVSKILDAEVKDKHCSRSQALRDWAIAYARQRYPDLAPASAVEELKEDA